VAFWHGIAWFLALASSIWLIALYLQVGKLSFEDLTEIVFSVPGSVKHSWHGMLRA